MSDDIIYFDLETIPDWSRFNSFDLDVPERIDLEKCPNVEAFCSQAITTSKEWLAEHQPPDSWLNKCELFERSSGKPRKGFIEELQKASRRSDDLRKQMATTPEYCRIVAAGWSGITGEIDSMVETTIDGERMILHTLWHEFAGKSRICGYNILGFDLPVLLTRSLLLGISPSRPISLDRYTNNVVLDLMQKRFANGKFGKLKSVCKALGIDVPAGDCDGSQVEDLARDDPDMLGVYVRSDVEITRRLHEMWSGYFCD
jgi:hypothetical protein